jgi:hypothetical protein
MPANASQGEHEIFVISRRQRIDFSSGGMMQIRKDLETLASRPLKNSNTFRLRGRCASW